MKAVFIRRYGGNDVLEYGELPVPKPGPGEVLVKVCAAGVNPVDYKIRDGEMKPLVKFKFPLVLGSELSGVVEAVGSGVTQFGAGDAVFARMGLRSIGAYAEYAVVEAEHAAHKPANLTHVQAAAVPLAALTAWQALFERGQLQSGQKVLIHAGLGGVGSFAIQLARHAGATVATTVGQRNLAVAQSLGANVAIDYRSQRFDELVSSYDLVLDTQGGDIQARSFRVLRPGGRLVTVVGMPDRAFAKAMGLPAPLGWLFHWMNRNQRAMAQRSGTNFDYLFMRPCGKQLAQIADLIAQDVVKPVLDQVFPLAHAGAALAYSATGRASGKVVVEVAA